MKGAARLATAQQMASRATGPGRRGQTAGGLPHEDLGENKHLEPWALGRRLKQLLDCEGFIVIFIIHRKLCKLKKRPP